MKERCSATLFEKQVASRQKTPSTDTTNGVKVARLDSAAKVYLFFFSCSEIEVLSNKAKNCWWGCSCTSNYTDQYSYCLYSLEEKVEELRLLNNFWGLWKGLKIQHDNYYCICNDTSTFSTSLNPKTYLEYAVACTTNVDCTCFKNQDLAVW